jgi:hypothetical protein
MHADSNANDEALFAPDHEKLLARIITIAGLAPTVTEELGKRCRTSKASSWRQRNYGRSRIGFPIVLFLIAFSIYLVTLAPTITWRNDGADGGDLITAAYTLGIAHPPGYPVYVVLGKLFTLLPIGDVAYRVNLMSAFFAAATIPLVYLVTLGLCRCLRPFGRAQGRHGSGQALSGGVDSGARIPRRILRLRSGHGSVQASQIAAGAAALSFAFSPTFWSQATIAEVYTLNAFFVALLFYLLLKGWGGRQRPAATDGNSLACLLLAAFIYGLSLGNHPSMLMLAPAIVFFIATGKWHRGVHLKGLLAAGLLFLLGLSIYLFLPLRALQHPPVNWGDPHTWSGFLWTVSGELYRRFLFALPPSFIPGRASAWASLLVQQFGWWGLLLGLIGLWHCLNKDRVFSTFSLLAFSAVVVYALCYNTTDSYVYLIPSYLVFATWLGVGVHYLLAALRQVQDRRGLTFYVSRFTLLFLCLPMVSLWRNFSSLDLSKDRTAYEYGTKAFEVLEPSAIVIADTDPHTFTLWYFSYVIGERPDAVVLNKTLLEYPWYRDNVRLLHPQVSIPNDGADVLTHLIKSNRADHPIYLTDNDPGLLTQYSFSRQGSLYLIEE